MSLLEIRNVTKTYAAPGAIVRTMGGSSRDETHALTGVTIELEQGEAHGIVGESGAGKTTLAATITGLEQPTSGEVRLDGATLGSTGDRKAWARKVQLVWQDPMAALDPRQRVGPAIAEPLSVQGVSREEARKRALALMLEVGLDGALKDRLPAEISGGQAQRVVIARALAVNPKLIICDEPASALDAPVKVQIANILMRLRRERGLSYLVIAHDLPLVRKLTDRITVLFRGAVVEQGPTRTVLEDPLHPYSRMLVASDPSTMAVNDWSRTAIYDEDTVAGVPESGCLFANRCASVTERCEKEAIPLKAVGDRKVACLVNGGYRPT